MKRITGLTADQAHRLTLLISEEGGVPGLPPIVSIQTGLKITLIYLRKNRTQDDLAVSFGVSQSTVSRTVTAMTPVIARVVDGWAPQLDEVKPGDAFVVDGTLAPCWSWRDRQDLYSGKHKTTGLNLQVVTDAAGRLRWVSDPLPGSIHDTAALDAHEILTGHDPAHWMADKGYIGRGMITPAKRRPRQETLDEPDRIRNTSIHKIRWVVEKAIANLKTWRILHTDYRRPIDTFATTISAVIGLHFYAASE